MMPLSAQRPELIAKRPLALIDTPNRPQRSRIAAEPLYGVIFHGAAQLQLSRRRGRASEPLSREECSPNTLSNPLSSDWHPQITPYHSAKRCRGGCAKPSFTMLLHSCGCLEGAAVVVVQREWTG